MKRIVRAVTALRHVFINMRRYPGLFAILDRSVGQMPESATEFITQAISDEMTADQVQVVLDIIDQYRAVPEDPHGPVATC